MYLYPYDYIKFSICLSPTEQKVLCVKTRVHQMLLRKVSRQKHQRKHLFFVFFGVFFFCLSLVSVVRFLQWRIMILDKIVPAKKLTDNLIGTYCILKKEHTWWLEIECSAEVWGGWGWVSLKKTSLLLASEKFLINLQKNRELR